MPRFELHQERKGKFVVRTIRVSVPKLPPSFQKFRIVHLTDLHYGTATPAKHLVQAVEIAGSLKPDLIVLTGDYIQNTRLGIDHRLATEVNPKRFGWMAYRRKVRLLANQLGTILKPLKSPHGIIGVFGNHDYLEGIGSIRRQLPADIEWLVNRSQYIRREGSSLLISGVDDYHRGNPDLAATVKSAQDLGKTYAQPCFKILLSHNPDIALDPNRELLKEFNLVLCGHTHGGQIRVPFFGAPLTRTKQRKHTSLLSSLGDTKFYVNHGAGYGGLQLRLWCPPEVSVVELVAG